MKTLEDAEFFRGFGTMGLLLELMVGTRLQAMERPQKDRTW